MTNVDLNDLYQEVILDHNKNPRNYYKLEGANRTAEGLNPLCGDEISVYMNLDGDRIKDISFLGKGCAISKASASLMTSILKGKTAAEAKALFDRVREMVTTGKCESDAGKLAVLAGAHKFPARVKCAILAWHAAVAALDEKTEPVSTESLED